MSQELLYTSAPRGLKPGSRGFCTVLSTQGMAAPLATALEGLSGYRPIYPAGDERASRNPVVASHLKLQAAGRSWSVLSRIADYGLDYSQRANKLAHHVVIDKSEQPTSGPASLLATRGYMRDEWSGEPKVVALKPGARDARAPSGPCRAWQETAGDAGWAGVLAESFLRDPERLVILLFAPGQDILPLFNEALSLLPPERRWDVTFSTYFTGLATSTTCVWRAMLHDSKEAHESLRFVNALRLDLTSGSLGPATGGDLVAAARSGTRPHAPPARPAKPFGPSEEEFVELEPAHKEFAAAEDPSADVRFAGIPQTPPPLAPPRNPQSAPYALTQPTTRRRLADVVAEESNRPRSRRWVWITLTTAMLLIAASIGLCFVPEVRTQISNIFPRPIPQSHKISETNSATTTTTNSQPASAPATVAAANAGIGDSTPAQPDPQNNPGNAASGGSNGAPNAGTPAPRGAGTPPASSQTSNDALNPTVPASTTKVELVAIPKKDGKATDLHSFDLPPSQMLPRLLLLKPHWLPYIDREPNPSHKTSHKAQRALVMPLPTGNDHQVIALFTAVDAPAPHVKYRLKSLLDDHVKWLGWYRIRVLSGIPGEPPLKELMFSAFPMKEETLDRKFKKAALNWYLPDTAVVDSKWKPELVLDRLTISIGDDIYPLNVETRDIKSQWTFKCADFASQTYAAFGEKVDSSAITLNIKIDIVANDGNPVIELKIEGKNFVKQFENALASKLFAEKSQLTELLAKIDDMSKSPLDEQLKGFSFVSSSDVMRSREIKKIIAGASERASKKIESEKDPTRLKELKELVAKLPTLVSLYDKIEQYHHLVDALNNVKIVSFRIYYELSCTTKDAAGASTTVKEVVDVVNFDDTKSSGETTKGP